MVYYLIRHGDTYHTQNNVPYGDEIESAQILPEAIPAIKKIAEFLTDKNIIYFFTSPYVRCMQTAKIITKITNKEFAVDKRLGEYRDDKGEDIPALGKRAKDFLIYLDAESYSKVAICTHGGLIAAFKHLLIYNEFNNEDLHDYPPPGYLTIIRDSKIEVVDFNNH